ncbi:MAG: 2-amino-4-hydroxy-6-hydroxymethyldihydropteridine diphosphokinase [Gammaproteobacteria bacterium]|nr:2-amino-4-hydroxy-6-hydroxymethyldihydropteridine diphosphokinase [Gammaproteobacteria bacterium]
MRAYVGLGSNLNDPARQVKSALAALNGIPETRCLRYSSLYRSAPLGQADQPDYINAVAMLETHLPAQQLLSELQGIERIHGRVRGAERWGPRTLDLDLLLYGDMRLESEELTVPHPRLAERSFVLYPLCEIAPDLEIYGLGGVQQLMAACRARDTLSCGVLV